MELAQNMLQDMQSEISMLITKLQQNLECLSQLPLEETTKTRDLQDEARRLENAFNSLQNKDRLPREPCMPAGSHTARWHDEEQELQEICALLEEAVVSRDEGPEGRGEALENLLSELDEGHLVNRSNAVIQEIFVGDILRHAWALDQEAILNAQKEALDEVRQTCRLYESS